MKLSIISKSISTLVAAFVATICLVSGSLVGASNDSCYKSVKKHVHSAKKQLDRLEKLELRLSKEAKTPITQKMMHEAGGSLVLRHSGDYCLTENICGTIVIEANSVCLDLCCHTLNAKGQPNAIVAEDYQGLKIFDGRIINASEAAILIDDYSAVELFKLIMSDTALDAIRITNSSALNLHDIDFVNDDSGERALLLDTCNNITVTHCNATGFLSTIGAVIQLDSCNAASVQDVDVTNCTKTAAADVDEFTAATALVSVHSSTGVDFVHVKVNNNIFNNEVPVADQNNHWRTAEAIAFFFSSSCSLHRCETSNNTDIAGALATLDTEDMFLLLIFCDGCIITEHQSNSNSSEQPITYFMSIAVLDSRGMTLEGCQANTNFASALTVAPFVSQMIIIEISSYFSFASSADNVIRNCQANFNNVALGGSDRPGFSTSGILFGIKTNGTGFIIDNCQANHNSMSDAEPHTAVTGIISDLATNTTISNSSADNNTGGALSSGILTYMRQTSTVRGFNTLISNCTANSNGNYGISIGYDDDLTRTNADATIIDCTCNQNGSANGPAAGIHFVPVVGGTRNVLIKGCQIYGTFADNGEAAGIDISNARNVVVEDTNVFNTTADGNGHGILFDTVTDSKIIRTQVHGNQDSGIELVGVNTNVWILDSIAVDNDIGFSVADGSTLIEGVIQGNKAIGNSAFGFEHAAVLPAPFDTGYQNNYAQNNGVNYSISSPIQIFTYDIPTAIYALVPNGASNYPAQANIDAS